MNLKNDKKRPIKGVYKFYTVTITLCILLALLVFNLNIYAKAVLCTLVFLCLCIMRSLKKAIPLPPDTTQKVESPSMPGYATDVSDADVEEAEFIKAETLEASEKTDTMAKKGGVIDTYLSLLIETDEELSSDPNIDTSSPSYNMLLNHRIGMKLDAMSQENNPSNKD